MFRCSLQRCWTATYGRNGARIGDPGRRQLWGCRLRFLDGAELPIDGSILVPIPTLDQVIEGTPVWREPAKTGDGDTYGVAVGGPVEAQRAWRQFVDAVGAA